MLAAFATLAFAATLWLVGAIALGMLEESGAKIAAALRGRSLLATAPTIVPIAARVSQRSRAARPLRAAPRRRAAA